jgi:hypothetical protein
VTVAQKTNTSFRYLGDRCSREGERSPLSLAEQEPFALMFTRRTQGDVIFNSPRRRAVESTSLDLIRCRVTDRPSWCLGEEERTTDLT